MTDDELIRELRSTSLLNRVRQLLSQSAARIDHSYRQRRHPSPIELRRMEFEDAQKIIDLVRSHYAEKLPTEQEIEDAYNNDVPGLLHVWCREMIELLGKESKP